MTRWKQVAATLIVMISGSLLISSCGLTAAQQIGVQLTNSQVNNAAGFSNFGSKAPAHFQLFGPQKHNPQGGETVISIFNDTLQTRQLTLVKTKLLPKDAKLLPKYILAAVEPGNHASIVAVSDVLKPAHSGANGGQISLIDNETVMHVYIAPGVQYMLFDRLGGGYTRGAACIIYHPKPGTSTPASIARALC